MNFHRMRTGDILTDGYLPADQMIIEQLQLRSDAHGMVHSDIYSIADALKFQPDFVQEIVHQLEFTGSIDRVVWFGEGRFQAHVIDEPSR